MVLPLDLEDVHGCASSRLPLASTGELLFARGLTGDALEKQLQENGVLAGDRTLEGDAEEQRRAGRRWVGTSWFCLLGSLASLGSLLVLVHPSWVGGGGGALSPSLQRIGALM